jgi:hypothetical protein
MSKKLLIIGRPHSSKTTFLAQFYSRLQKKKSKGFLYKPVENLTAIKEARELLSDGQETKTTHTERTVAINLPIQLGNQKIDLSCPDYGGEQINTIVRERVLNEGWKNAIQESDNWILFIRISSLTTAFDLSNKTVSSEQIAAPKDVEVKFLLSDQSFFIELLQVFMSAKGLNQHLKCSKLKLTILLTCWDELNTSETPSQVLQKHLPLLLSFIEANFLEDRVKILGLSAQGFSLNNPENIEKYQIDGPDNFGYIVKDDGSNTPDITELILEAL